MGQHLVRQGLNHRLAEGSAAAQRPGLSGSFPLHPLPPEDKGASQRSMALGLRLQEAQPRTGGRGLLSACMSGELGRDLVPGTGFFCVSQAGLGE